MQWSVRQEWREGRKMDRREQEMTRDSYQSGWLVIEPDETGCLVASFRRPYNKAECAVLPDLRKVEIVRLGITHMTIAGLQRSNPKGGWHYQVWQCHLTHGDRTT